MLNYKRRAGDIMFDVCNVAFFILLALLMVFPLWNVLMVSLVGAGEFYARSLIVWPRTPTIDAYRYIFGKNSEIFSGFRVTVLLTVVGSVYSLIVTTALAYGLSKKYLPGRNLLLTLITITMFFAGGLIPYYLLIRSLGLIDTFCVLFIPSAVSTWNFIVIKSFFGQISTDLEEAARIDGANDIVVFIRIVLPLSKPVLATFLLFYAVGYWNSWWPSTIFCNSPRFNTLQFVLRNMLQVGIRAAQMDAAARQAGRDTANLFEEGIKMATVVVATGPILCVYPFLQKYFAKGVMLGSIKG